MLTQIQRKLDKERKSRELLQKDLDLVKETLVVLIANTRINKSKFSGQQPEQQDIASVHWQHNNSRRRGDEPSAHFFSKGFLKLFIPMSSFETDIGKVV